MPKARFLVDRLSELEADARSHGELMAESGGIHAELDRRIEKLETELAAVRQERLDAYSRWWQAREDYNRATHVARRLRRRILRLRRRGAACPET